MRSAHSWAVLSTTASLVALLYLISQATGLLFPPSAVGSLLVELLPRAVLGGAYALLIALALYLDQVVETIITQTGQLVTLLSFVTLLLLIAKRLSRWCQSYGTPTRIGAGLLVALLVGATVVMITIVHMVPPIALESRIWWVLGGYLVAFLGWGGLVGWLAGYQPTMRRDTPTVALLSRRQFMRRMSVSLTLVTALWVGSGRLLGQRRQEQAAQALVRTMELPPTVPPTLQAQRYPYRPGEPFPEFVYARYHPAHHPFGVCLSGGGIRAAVAAWGQLRGLQALGLLDAVGAISCVSGGAWCTAIWSYAPVDIDDATLLGPVLEAAALTPVALAELDPRTVVAPFTQSTTDRIVKLKTDLMTATIQAQTQPFDRVYSRLLNELLLKPFGLADPYTLFTLNEEERAHILATNPALTVDSFYLMRPDRPFLIAGITQEWPVGDLDGLRQVESTPLYTGLPQLFPHRGVDGATLGGGYIDTFAFDSDTPIQQNADVVTVATPAPLYLLSDLLGATSSAPGILLNQLHEPKWFPQFRYWSPAQPDVAAAYSFIDGAALDNLGIIPLLRRQYPIILAFVNGGQPVGSDSPFTVEGIDHAIARLFGYMPEAVFGSQRSTQIFPQEKFQPLRDALHAAKAAGRAAIYVDSYPIVQPNPFDLPPYPATAEQKPSENTPSENTPSANSPGEVTVVWFHEDRSQRWFDELPESVRLLFESADPANDLRNFPHFDGVAQNRNQLGIPQLFQLTPVQINLLAHICCDIVRQDAGAQLLALRQRLA